MMRSLPRHKRARTVLPAAFLMKVPVTTTKENDIMYLRLHENGPEFAIGHDLLLGLARALGKRGGYPDLVTALLELHIPSLSTALLNGSGLETEHMDRIWESGDLGVRRVLANDDKFIRKLTDRQAEDIIETDDVFMLRHLACRIESLEDEDDLSEYRISPAKRDALLLHLRQHPDMRIRESLANNEDLSDAMTISVSERLRLGLDLNYSVCQELRMDELPAILQLSSSELSDLAIVADMICDQEVRHAVMEALASFPDPAVRMKLAESTTENAAILAKLAADQDPGVSAAARKKLEEIRRIADEEEREDD